MGSEEEATIEHSFHNKAVKTIQLMSMESPEHAGLNATEYSGEFESPYWPRKGEEHIHPAFRNRGLHSVKPELLTTEGNPGPPHRYSLFPKITPLPSSSLTLPSPDPEKRPEFHIRDQKDLPTGSAGRPFLLKSCLTNLSQRFKSVDQLKIDGCPALGRTRSVPRSLHSQGSVGRARMPPGAGGVARRSHTESTQLLALVPGANIVSMKATSSRLAASGMRPSSESREGTSTDYGAASEGTLELILSYVDAARSDMPQSRASDDVNEDIYVMIDEVLEMYHAQSPTDDPTTQVAGVVESEHADVSRDDGMDSESGSSLSDTFSNLLDMFPTPLTESQRQHAPIGRPEQTDPDSANRASLPMISRSPADRFSFAAQNRHTGNPDKIRRQFGLDSGRILQDQLGEKDVPDRNPPMVTQDWLSVRRNSIIRRSGDVRRTVSRSIGNLKDIIRNS